jgi:hypothetical protein
MTPSPVWREIESAPKDGTYLLLCEAYDDGSWNMVVGRWDGGWWSKEPFPHEPTHWMPLPPPPTQEQTDDR